MKLRLRRAEGAPPIYSQVASLLRTLPPRYLPADAYLVSYSTEEHLFGSADRLSKQLVGVFQRPWSANAALKRAYARDDLHVLTPHEGQITLPGGDDKGEPVLFVSREQVPVDRTVLFTYRSGSALAVESFAFKQKRRPKRTVRFPIAAALHRDDLPTLEEIMVRES